MLLVLLSRPEVQVCAYYHIGTLSLCCCVYYCYSRLKVLSIMIGSSCISDEAEMISFGDVAWHTIGRPVPSVLRASKYTDGIPTDRQLVFIWKHDKQCQVYSIVTGYIEGNLQCQISWAATFEAHTCIFFADHSFLTAEDWNWNSYTEKPSLGMYSP